MMAPVTPLHRDFSTSERNLSIPHDAPEVEGGLCNDAYEGDPIRDMDPVRHKSFQSTPIQMVKETVVAMDETSSPEKPDKEKGTVLICKVY